MIGIYKITNLINNKAYIGQSVDIERRWKEHCRLSANSLIAKKIRQYNKDNFLFEVIEECAISQLDEKENYWIQYYNTIVPNGYNILEETDTNHTNYCFYDKDIIDKIFDLLLNSNLTQKQIADKLNVTSSMVSRINTGSTHFQNNISYPIRIFEKTPQNYCIECGVEISVGATRCVKCENNHRYIVNDNPSKEELREILLKYNGNFTQVGKLFKVSDNTIRKWCKKYNLPYHSKDYKVKTTQTECNIKNTNKPKPVEMLDINTNQVLNTFSSLSEAGRFLNRSSSHIGEVCNGICTTAYGYKWRYARVPE